MAYDTRDLPPPRTEAQKRADEHYRRVEQAFKELSPEMPLQVRKDAFLTILLLYGGPDLISGCRQRFEEERAADMAVRGEEQERRRVREEEERRYREQQEAERREHDRRMRSEPGYALRQTIEQGSLRRRS